MGKFVIRTTNTGVKFDLKAGNGEVIATSEVYSSEDAFAFKPGAAVAIARRGGTTASFDAVNKYFGISNMPVVSSSYWNIAHGCTPGEVTQDAEGMQTMRNLARNMAWMLKCFEAGKASGVSLPAIERGSRTNFIR